MEMDTIFLFVQLSAAIYGALSVLCCSNLPPHRKARLGPITEAAKRNFPASNENRTVFVQPAICDKQCAY